MSKLLHYCENKFILSPFPPIKEEYKMSLKPRGLYLSVDDAWMKWCTEEDFFHRLYQWVYEFEINVNANILKIQTLKELKEFDTKYKKVISPKFYMIDWELVKEQYSGIAFLNYQKIKRELIRNFFQFTWYFGLDVDCYVIWDHEILKVKSCNSFHRVE